MPERTPLILLILKLPFQIIQLLLYAVGLFTYLPIYVYSLAFSKFLFSQKFESSQPFYVIFCLPRAIISTGCFLIGAGELYLIYWAITRFIDFGSTVALVFTLIAIIIFTMFSFRFGYKLLFNIFQLPKLNSVTEHLTLILYGIEDIVSAIFTLVTLVLIFRAKSIFSYQFAPNERKYLAFSFRMLRLSIVDAICLVFWLIVFILHWRFAYTRRGVQELESEEKKHLFVVEQAANAIIDLIFLPLFLIAVFNPFLKGTRLLTHMNRLPITSWRRLIFEEFVSTLLDLPSFICFILGLVTIYQIPLGISLYKSTIRRIKPYDFPNDLESVLVEENNRQEDDHLGAILAHNEENDDNYRGRYFIFLSVAILDILLLIINILIRLFIYRYFIFQRKIQTIRLRVQQGLLVENDLTLTYAEYRTFLYSKFSLENPPAEHHSTYSTYPGLVLTELFWLVIDIPIILLSFQLFVAPWRLYEIYQLSKMEWRSLAEVAPASNRLSLRVNAIFLFFMSILDYIWAFLSLVAFWRWNYTFPELWAIIKSDVEPDESKEACSVRKFDTFDAFIFQVILCVIVDVLFLVVILLFVPFYIVCFWRFALLARCLRSSYRFEFMKHRCLVLHVGLICVLDFLKLIPLLVTIITIFRIPTLWKLATEKYKQKKDRTMIDEQNNSLEVGMLQLEEQDVLIEQAPPQIEEQRVEGPLTASQIIAAEESILLLDAGAHCGLLVFLDIFSLPFVPFLYTKASSRRKFFNKLHQCDQEQRNANTIGKYCEFERKKVYARYRFGGSAFCSRLVIILLVVLLFMLLWRIPTFLIINNNRNLYDRLLRDLYALEPTREAVRRSRIKRLGVVVRFCLEELISDLLFVPIFLLLITLTFWRSGPTLKGIYRYVDTVNLSHQTDQERYRMFTQFLEGLKDILAFIKIVFIIGTLFRIPFFVMIILKNRFPNSSLSRKLFPTQALLDRPLEQKLSVRKCINITFKEFLKDLPYVLLGIFVTVFAPWRILSLYSIFKSQTNRIPTHDIEAKSLKITSRRTEVGQICLAIVQIDYAVLLKMVVLVLTIYRIPLLVVILVRFVFNFKKYQTGELSLSNEIGTEYSIVINAVSKLLFSLLIIILILRIPSTIQRLAAYRRYLKTKEREARYKQSKYDDKTQEERLSLNHVTWDVYGRICQYLHIKDLAQLSQVNKKFHSLNQKDFYWEYQYKRDWSEYQGLKEEVTFRQKCISAYKSSLAFSERQPLPQDKLDTLYGTYYILFDEVVNSIRCLPHFLLLPVKLVCLLLRWTVGFCVHKTEFPLYVSLWGRRFTDILRHELRTSSRTDELFPTLEETKTFFNIHNALISWVVFVFIKYICAVGYIIGGIGCFFIWLFNAGETLSMRIETEENEQGRNVRVLFRRNRNAEGEPLIYGNRFFRYLLYVCQLILTIANTIFISACFAVFPFLLIYYYNWEWYEAIFGPCCILLVHYAAVFNVIITEIWYILRAAYFFRPYRAITEFFIFIFFVATETWRHIGMPLCRGLGNGMIWICNATWDVLKFLYRCIEAVVLFVYKVVKAIFKAIWKVLEWIGKGLKVIFMFIYDIIKFICNIIWEGLKILFNGLKTAAIFIFNVFKGLYSAYVGVLAYATTLSLKWGYVGDILLIPFVLLWMLWPLLIPIFLDDKIYFIPCGLISALLVFLGYNTIKEVTQREPKD